MYQCKSGTFASPTHRFFKAGKQKTGGESRRPADRQKRSKSSSYRNRSLKQLFGDIPAINEYQSIQLTCKPKEIIKPKASPTPAPQVTKKESIDDEYLIKHKERLKSSKRQDHLRAGLKKQEERYKRKHIADEKAADSTTSTQRAQTGSAFYDPNAYSWRKTPSKDKDIQKSPENKRDGLPSKLSEAPQPPEMVQSEYYGTPRHSQMGANTKKAVEEIKLQRMRSSSIEFLKKEKPAKLRPRVAKHIFEVKSPRQKHHSLNSKTNLLFTFGI